MKAMLQMIAATVLVGSSASSSSMTDETVDEQGFSNCPDYSLFNKNFNITFSRGAQTANLKATASISIGNPKNSNDGYQTVVALKFTARDFVTTVGNLFKMHEASGCDRLTYNNDAAMKTEDKEWIVSGHFKYEERICTNFGSTSVGNITRPVHITIRPQLDLIVDGAGSRLITNISASYEIPIFLTFGMDGDLFDIGTQEHEIPEIAAANLESHDFEISDNGKDLISKTIVWLRPLPKSLACLAKKSLGEALWDSGDWGRAH